MIIQPQIVCMLRCCCFFCSAQGKGGGGFCFEMRTVRQVSLAPDWGGVRVAMVTRDVTAGGGSVFV